MSVKSHVTVVVLVIAAVALPSTGAVAGTLITTRQIKDRTILMRDLAPSTRTSLKAAATTKIYQKSLTQTIEDGAMLGYAVACNTGDLAIGGGVKPSGSGVIQQGSYPNSAVAGNAWVQQVWNQSGTSRSVVLYAVCIDR